MTKFNCNSYEPSCQNASFLSLKIYTFIVSSLIYSFSNLDLNLQGLPDSTVIDVSRAKLSEELFGTQRLEVVDEELPELEDVVPGKVLATFDHDNLQSIEPVYKE
jgi:hypothetical protein